MCIRDRASGHVPETLHNIRTIHCLAKEAYMEERYDTYIGESYAAVSYTHLDVYKRQVCEIASHGDCTPRPFQKKASDPRSDPRATVGKVV